MKDSARVDGTDPAPLILVLGMHRSGTSLLGSLLQAIGIPFPGDLIVGDINNPEGYFERRDITDIQENLLIGLGHWWPSQQGVFDLPLTWLSDPQTQQCAARIRRVLEDEAARQSVAWAIKDPRSSLLLPLWRRLAADLRLPLRLVLSLRDPAEVSVSLLRRDHQVTGMSPWRAQQLWWRHYCQVILDSHGLPLHVVPYGSWFESSTGAREQLRQLARFCGVATPSAEQERQALALIRPQHRRSRLPALRLLPIHPQLRQLERRLMDLTAEPEGRRAIEQWLSTSRQPIVLPLSEQRHGLPPQETPAALAPSDHPLAAAALALHGGHHGRARRQLQHWIQQGTLAPAELDQVEVAAGDAFPLLTACELPHALLPASPSVRDRARLVCWGESWSDWQIHAWLQHVPLPIDPGRWEVIEHPDSVGEEEWSAPPHGEAEPDHLEEAEQGRPTNFWIGLHFQEVTSSNEAGLLARLARLDAVFDPDPGRVDLLRRLGIRAFPLVRGNHAANDWLWHAPDVEAIARRFGLPDPEALVADDTSLRVMALGSGGADWERQLAAPCWCLPGFDSLLPEGCREARLLAAWLERCQRAGLQLIRFDPNDEEKRLEGFQMLSHPLPLPPGWLPIQFFQRPLAVGAVAEELAWRRQGRPEPPPCQTPAPTARCLWERRGGVAAAAVCISLHNYADRIEVALESVGRQTLGDLELIVVDDASGDGGEETVRRWLERNAARFSRTVLLRHHSNGGLASARNTAFAACEAPWAFVLDADNQLLPEAVSDCLRVAQAAPPSAAVVHGLVEVVTDGSPAPEQASCLISHQSWQKHLFRLGNYIDAMALVRVAAWRAVGGYVHIPGGWEDFDFWCLLIEAGYHGVLCPQRLAIYHRHGDSMLSTTNLHLRRISRLLNARHPWLELPMARRDV